MLPLRPADIHVTLACPSADDEEALNSIMKDLAALGRCWPQLNSGSKASSKDQLFKQVCSASSEASCPGEPENQLRRAPPGPEAPSLTRLQFITSRLISHPLNPLDLSTREPLRMRASRALRRQSGSQQKNTTG
ncbi:hypothetical protein Z043_115082 [Scleropages formosus]|uniref:Uncharacterized protein n=1 Tax=Scleropages formosus TaxID=113540 RepID=A0A0P7TY63_SCLFO|nr:hypothetical protein Z043_115082 [Scleropages formosus]